MDVELFLHGVPHGSAFYGKEEDRTFFNNFYDGKEDETNLLIQLRTANGKSYAYYSYLVKRGVKDDGGRDGSYFGITIRFDCYCKDFNNLYGILSTLFNSYVMGKIIKKEGADIDIWWRISQARHPP